MAFFRSIALVVAWSIVLVLSQGAKAEPLPRSTPEAQGINSARVLEFVEALNEVDAPHSVMIVRHGHVVAEGWWTPYRATARHSLYSLSKSFTSTAVGLAVAEGKLSVDDEVVKFFPEDAPADPSNFLKAMRVSDLLRMATGHQTEPSRTAKEPWVKTFLAHPVPFRPGTHFLYNTSATYMQSAIVQKVTGQTVRDYLQTRLFAPLGIEDPTWEQSPQGISTGGYGLSIRTEDIAKFGLLYLNKGEWHGEQLVPEAWVEAATARQTSNGSNPLSDWEQGYGYQFWRSTHGAYRGDGAFGQFCVVLPEHDAVVAITSGVRNMPGELGLVWSKLLPALEPAALAPAAEACQKLADRLQHLTLPTPQSSSAPDATPVGKTYHFSSNELGVESAELSIDGAATTLVLRTNGAEQRIPCGANKWTDTQAAWGTLAQQPVAAAGGWSADGFTAKLCFYETPFTITLRLKPQGDELTINSETNVGFTQTKGPELQGKVR